MIGLLFAKFLNIYLLPFLQKALYDKSFKVGKFLSKL